MNTFNVVVDTWNVFGDDTETMLIVYAVCHMVGMSSVSSLICRLKSKIEEKGKIATLYCLFDK
jgi:neuropeptide Y receptor